MSRLAGAGTVLLFIVLTLASYSLRLTTTPLPVPIFVVLTILFVTSGSIVVSYVAAVAYVRRGVPSMLLLSSGSLLFSATSLVAALAALREGILGSNVATTIFVVGAVVSGLFHLLAVGSRPAKSKSERGTTSVAAAAGILVLILALSIILGSYLGALPAFLVPGVGTTQVAKLVLAMAIGEFGLAAVIIAPSTSRSRVQYWYCSALAMTAVALAGLLLSDWVFPRVVFSVGRLALCVAGAFMILSVLSAEQPFPSSDSIVEELFKS